MTPQHPTETPPDLQPARIVAALGDAAEAVELLVLFGSSGRAAGDVRPVKRLPRDVDLGVRYRDDTSVRQRWRVEGALRRHLRPLDRREVDVIDLASAPPLLRFEVARDGKLLYESRPYLWADFRARAMVDWWDWAPYQRRMDRGAVRRLREATLGSS